MNFSPYPGGVLAFFGGVQPLTAFSVSYDLLIRCYGDPQTRKCPYSHFIHVWSATMPRRDIPAEFRTVVDTDSKYDDMDSQKIKKYMNTVHFQTVSSCDGAALVDQLGQLPACSSIYVHCSQVYRFADLDRLPRASSSSIDGLQMSVNVAEDMASNHAQRLVEEALRIAHEKQSVIILSFESSGFADDRLPDTLKNEGNFATVNVAMSETHARLRTEFRYCLDHVSDIAVNDALKRINEADAPKIATALCCAGFLSARSLHERAWDTISNVYDDILSSGLPSHLLSVAQIAFAAGKKDKAAELLAKADSLDPHDLELLATLHTLTERIEGPDCARNVLNRLSTLFPNDPVSKAKHLKLALADRDFTAAQQLATDIGDDYFISLCEALSADKLPVKTFLEAARKMGKEDRALRDMAREASRRGRYGASWRFLRMCRPGAEVVSLQCRVFARRVLRSHSLTDSFADDLAKIMEYVARHPGELEPRFALDSIIEDDLDDYTAMVLLAAVMDKGATRFHITAMENGGTNECGWVQDPSMQSSPDNESYEILMDVIKTFPKVSLPGEGSLLASQSARASPKTLFDWIYMQQHDEAWLADEDHRTRLLLIHAILLLAKHLNDPTTDALAMRYAVMSQGVAGRLQEARDMAETALLVLPTVQPEYKNWRFGLGWLCLAEAFQRGHNPQAALLSVGLALLAVDDEIPSMKGAKEILRLCSRIARDICIFPLALKYIQYERDIIHRLQVDTDTEYQLLQMEHAIRTMHALAAGSEEDLQNLVREGCEYLEQKHDDQPAPMLSSLAALLSHLQQRGADASSEHREIFTKYLQDLPSDLRDILLSQVETRPTKDTLERLAKRMGDANSFGDLAFQGRPLRIAAERAVAYSYETRDTLLYILASGVLAQPMLSMSMRRTPAGQGIDSNAINEWLYHYVDARDKSQEKLVDVMKLAGSQFNANKVSFSGVLELTPESVVGKLNEGEIATVLSRDKNGSLYSLQIGRNGVSEIRCLSPDLWIATRYKEWCRSYPYSYGDWVPNSDPLLQEQPTAQDILDSVSGLSIDGWGPDAHNLIVPDSGLFGFPFNLLSCGDQFAGHLHRMSCVPSLAWLINVRDSPATYSDRTVAWFGAPRERHITMDMLESKLQNHIGKYGIDISSSNRPEGCDNKALAIVAAHGKVGSFGQFVSVTADMKIRFTPDEFAAFFSGCGCVVLFICSAGRSDEKQHTSETRSLVTELFENDVRSVIAPVWPITIDVAESWLPEFLCHYSKGESAVNSAHAAARKVENKFPNPCAWAGMQVYGDGSQCWSGHSYD